MDCTTKLPEDNGTTPRIRNIPLEFIAVDRGCQSRAAIDSDTVADYSDAIRSGTEMPPAVVFYDGAQYWLADGFHRREAHAKAGKPSMACEVREGTRRDAVLFSVGANATHGLRRKSEDKRRAVQTLLADSEWKSWSNREIARRAGVHFNFVAKLRTELTITRSDSEKPEPRTYTTKHGTTATMRTSGIGRKPATPELDELDNLGCSDFGPVETPGEPWADFVAEAQAGVEILQLAKARFADVFGYNPRDKTFSERYAGCLSPMHTLSAIDTIISNITGGLPAAPSDTATGFLTARQVEIRNAQRVGGR